MPGTAVSLILVGSAAGLLGTPAAVAAPPASATPGAGQFVPHPGTSSFLNGLACPSPVSCWAIGWYGPAGGAAGAILNQALHWNGRKWSLVFAPEPGGTVGGDINNLYSIRCTSSPSCWAVGQYRIKLGVELNQILRWNGTRWSAA